MSLLAVTAVECVGDCLGDKSIVAKHMFSTRLCVKTFLVHLGSMAHFIHPAEIAKLLWKTKLFSIKENKNDLGCRDDQ
jgi:hypothetical protein